MLILYAVSGNNDSHKGQIKCSKRVNSSVAHYVTHSRNIFQIPSVRKNCQYSGTLLTSIYVVCYRHPKVTDIALKWNCLLKSTQKKGPILTHLLLPHPIKKKPQSVHNPSMHFSAILPPKKLRAVYKSVSSFHVLFG